MKYTVSIVGKALKKLLTSSIKNKEYFSNFVVEEPILQDAIEQFVDISCNNNLIIDEEMRSLLTSCTLFGFILREELANQVRIERKLMNESSIAH
jgi:hypothetical protein